MIDEENPSTRLLRGLRGGSGDGGFPGPDWAKILLGVVGFLLVVTIVVNWWFAESSTDSAARAAEFEKAVSDAKKRRTSNSARDSATAGATPSFETFSGDFDIDYRHGRKKVTRSLKIRLHKNGDEHGFNIEGDCTGSVWIATRITDGFVSFSGDTWWVEETKPGTGSGWKGVVEGKFAFASNTFTGTWRANNGLRGRYSKIKGGNVSTTSCPVQATALAPQALARTVNENIPVAIAMLIS